MKSNIEEILSTLPLSPGVYIMYNSEGKIIYIGKAKSLKKRVSQYFLKDRDAKTTALVSHIANIEYIVTGNEYEALILENNLIKKHKPRYNIDLKDGKTYQMIRITNEEFPKVFKTRRLTDDGSIFYGPYPKGLLLDSYMNLLTQLYPLRRCQVPLKKRRSPCLYYHIGKCKAPCSGLIDKEEYNKYITDCKKLLEGQTESLRATLEKDMLKESKAMNYEKAGVIRDLIKAIDVIISPQSVQNNSKESHDYIALVSNGPIISIAIMQLREGALLGKAIYRVETIGTTEEILTSFLLQYYNTERDIPNTIYVSHDLDIELLEKYFKEHLNDIKFEIPLDGRHYRALRLAEQNAKEDVNKRLKKIDNTPALEELRRILNLDELPTLIEGYDISHLSGKYTVASLISFKDGISNRSGYRRFNIKSLDGKIDDYASIKEAVERRYKRVIEENLTKPSLVFTDGGKGQVNVAREVLDNLGLADIPVVGLREKEEIIVFDDDREDLVLPFTNPGLRLLIEIRDECHRFAHTANENMRTSDSKFKLLCSIRGVGEARAKQLMTEFESIENIISSKPDDISKKAHIPLTIAERIIKELSL